MLELHKMCFSAGLHSLRSNLFIIVTCYIGRYASLLLCTQHCPAYYKAYRTALSVNKAFYLRAISSMVVYLKTFARSIQTPTVLISPWTDFCEMHGLKFEIIVMGTYAVENLCICSCDVVVKKKQNIVTLLLHTI